ncbi:MAG: cation transporter [Candidatus Ventricola sp.]|nr:cation transporter [Candidatus Ventricola sp.]
MLRITVDIDGMACAMCESHVNEAIRKALPVKKVTSSHGKGCAQVFAEREISREELERALEGTGYRVTGWRAEPAKKGLLGWR